MVVSKLYACHRRFISSIPMTEYFHIKKTKSTASSGWAVEPRKEHFLASYGAQESPTTTNPHPRSKHQWCMINPNFHGPLTPHLKLPNTGSIPRGKVQENSTHFVYCKTTLFSSQMGETNPSISSVNDTQLCFNLLPGLLTNFHIRFRNNQMEMKKATVKSSRCSAILP